jgi:hypothetical protein
VERIAILGSGMAGFGAAHRFHTEGHRATLYEKRPYHGGHTASYAFDNGFTIDEGPTSVHPGERIQKLFAESVDQKFERLRRRSTIIGRAIGSSTRPGISTARRTLIVDVLKVLFTLASQYEIKNYQDWLMRVSGKPPNISMEYSQYHTTTAANMSTDYARPRLIEPNQGSCAARFALDADVHYTTSFAIHRGGFVSSCRCLKQADLQADHG